MSEIFERNILDEIYQVLSSNDKLAQLVPPENIWLHYIPEDKRDLSPVIRISQTGWMPYEYASNTQINYIAEFQIDVWMRQEDGEPFQIGQIIQSIMKEENFQQNTPNFGYDPDTEMLRDGRRYVGYIYI